MILETIAGVGLGVAAVWAYGRHTALAKSYAQKCVDYEAVLQRALNSEIELRGMKSTLDTFKDKPVVAVLNDQQAAGLVNAVAALVSEKIERGLEKPKVH